MICVCAAELVLGSSVEVEANAIDRPVGSEVYRGEQEDLKSSYRECRARERRGLIAGSAVVLRRARDDAGNLLNEFQVSTITEWYTFTKDTILDAAVLEQDMDEVEKAFEQHQQTSTVSVR
jgi:hypothetical protein